MIWLGNSTFFFPFSTTDYVISFPLPFGSSDSFDSIDSTRLHKLLQWQCDGSGFDWMGTTCLLSPYLSLSPVGFEMRWAGMGRRTLVNRWMTDLFLFSRESELRKRVSDLFSIVQPLSWESWKVSKFLKRQWNYKFCCFIFQRRLFVFGGWLNFNKSVFNQLFKNNFWIFCL